MIDEIVVRKKQSVTIIHLESLKCFLVYREESTNLNTLHVLHCKQHFVGEQENNTILKKILKICVLVVVVWIVMTCLSIKMFTNFISCLYRLDGSDIFYIYTFN